MVPDAPLACFQNSAVGLRLVIVVAFREIVQACPTNVYVEDAEMEDSCLVDDDVAAASQVKEPSDAPPWEEASGGQ